MGARKKKKKAPAKVHVLYNLPPDLVERIKAERARPGGLNASHLVEHLLRDYFARHPGRPR